MGAPPYPHTRYPRIVGLLRVRAKEDEAPRINYLHGNAVDPPGAETKLIAHVVNDKTANWGGHGFAPQLRQRYPGLQESFRQSAEELWNSPWARFHVHEVEPGLRVCTMVAQHGYGAHAAKIPLRYAALEECLRRLRAELEETQPPFTCRRSEPGRRAAIGRDRGDDRPPAA